ncbi:MAG TPA: hypothetical protein VKC60_03335 [Opitutaceae bacterium]|nr:hypothetical protein [Opitutaceae bacterium]
MVQASQVFPLMWVAIIAFAKMRVRDLCDPNRSLESGYRKFSGEEFYTGAHREQFMGIYFKMQNKLALAISQRALANQ